MDCPIVLIIKVKKNKKYMTMRLIVYGVAGIVVLFMGRSYLKGYILKLKEKKTKIVPVKKDFVYVPLISSRTFQFAIEITEIGDGKATISVVKNKDKI